jgi:hypothetical protein
MKPLIEALRRAEKAHLAAQTALAELREICDAPTGVGLDETTGAWVDRQGKPVTE